MNAYLETIKKNWQIAWLDKWFRKGFIIGLILVVGVLACLSVFFDYVEKRHGIILNDWLLARIPAYDVSYLLLFFIWSTVLLSIYRAVAEPQMFITFLFAYIIFIASRILSMYLVPFDPPTHLIAIRDPLSNMLYGDKFITRDLFYSGHTGTLFLFYLCLTRKKDQYYALLATVVVAMLLLVQHVHYTIDIVAAPFCTYGCYWLGRKILRFNAHGLTPAHEGGS